MFPLIFQGHKLSMSAVEMSEASTPHTNLDGSLSSEVFLVRSSR